MSNGQNKLNTLRQLTWILCLAILAGCGEMDGQEVIAETEPVTGVIMQPVRYGNLDGDGHPGILRLYIRVGNSGFLCSGTVIEQRTILTAAHCIENAASAADVYVVIDGVYRAANAMHIHEGYSANAAHIRRLGDNFYRYSGPDVAILTFADDLPAPVVAIEMGEPNQGDLLTIVGFGANENEETGIRRVGQVEYQATTETYLENQQTVDNAVGSLVVNPGPNNELVCGGDSGGALLMGQTLIGVTSGGVVAVGDDNPCVRSRSANFISPAAYIDWIRGIVDLPQAAQPEIAPELLCSAYLLDSDRRFGNRSSYTTNWGGLNEKWFRSGDAVWHYILPQGAVYEWTNGTNPPTGNLVGTFSPDFHANPDLLTAAINPGATCQPPAVDNDTLAQSAYDMDQEYGFTFSGTYATNWAGMGEKWFQNTNRRWFYITPVGEVFRWENNSRPIVGALLATFSANYHANPTLLHDAIDPSSADADEADNADCVDTTAEAKAFNLDQTHGFVFTGSFAENWGSIGEKWFQNANGRWHYITPAGEVYKWTQNTRPAQGNLIETLDATYHADPMLLISAEAPANNTCDGGADLATQAAQLDSTYGFTSNGNYNENWGSQTEKWMSNINGNWFYIVPDGGVYRWTVGTRPIEGTQVAQLDASYWANPALLHDAAAE